MQQLLMGSCVEERLQMCFCCKLQLVLPGNQQPAVSGNLLPAVPGNLQPAVTGNLLVTQVARGALSGVVPALCTGPAEQAP